MKTETMVNGVPVDQLAETMGAVRKEPTIAKFEFRAENRWQEGARNRARIDSYHGALEDHYRPVPFRIGMDEAPVLLGADTGPNPVEVLLSALSGCLTTSLVYHAAAMGIELTSVESRYEGDLDLHGFLGMDENVRNGFSDIRVVFTLAGDATEEQLDELVRVAQARSPVFDVVTHGTRVAVRRER